MRFILHPYPCVTSGSSSYNAGATPTRTSALSSVSAAAPLPQLHMLPLPPPFPPPHMPLIPSPPLLLLPPLHLPLTSSARVTGRTGPTYLPPSSSRSMVYNKNSTVALGSPTPSKYPLDTSKRSVVDSCGGVVVPFNLV